VRTRVGGSSIGSSNWSEFGSRDADTAPLLAGAGSGPQAGSISAAIAAQAPVRRLKMHGLATFMSRVVEEHNSRWSDHLSI
jgi:hypothetical protein